MPPFRVALLIESSRSYGRELLAGIAAYARAYGPWAFYHEERSLGDPLSKGLKRWRPQGILARLEDRSLLRLLQRWRVPIVDLLHEEGVSGVPGVFPDSDAITRMAVEHLEQLRVKHFAYCGLPGVVFSDRRCGQFVRRLNALGCRVHVFKPPRFVRARRLADVERIARSHAHVLAAWLRELPKPVGVMACNDMRAFQVLSACRESGVMSPDEVAVLGVDNDAVQCELCDPPLSSVDNNAWRVGFQAATLLDRMMRGAVTTPRRVLIEPVGVVVRRSTDMLAIADQDAADTVRYVRDHACEGLNSVRLARRLAISRSTLERQFARYLGHSVHQEIQRVRLDRIKELLATSHFSLGEIAQSTGFAYVETMQRMFKRRVGQTPGQYRSRRQNVGLMAALANEDG
ncbi:MAG: DNA-binding transcriptional regulator [Planctomycetaceae bacterium]|nr:DNA-binding transcriptional regulator [Planctomycetaceae bacterium]